MERGKDFVANCMEGTISSSPKCIRIHVTLFSETSLPWLGLADGIAFTRLKSGHALKSTEISGSEKNYLRLWTSLVVPKEVSPDHCSAGKLCFADSLS